MNPYIAIILYIILTLLGSIYYRLGGEIDKKYRKIMTNVCSILIFLIFRGFSWWLLPVILIQYFTLGTYWKGEEPDVLWYHWIYTGVGYGLSAFPLLFCGVSWESLLCRTLILGVWCMLVSEFSDDVRVEELGRGALFTGTMGIL